MKRIGTTNGHQSGNVYSTEGLSPCLCCTDYKAPIKVLVGGGKMEDKLKNNFTKIDDETYVTTERERLLLCSNNTPTRQSDT